MICSKCGMSYDDSKTKCPYCDELNPTKAQTGEAEVTAKTQDEQENTKEAEESAQEVLQENVYEETSDASKDEGFTSSNVNQQQPKYTASPSQNSVNGLAIGSMVCGIISLPLIFTIFGGLVLGIVAIVLAANSKKQYGPSGYAVAGLVCGIISVIVSAVVIIFFFVAMAMAATIAGSGANILNDIISIG